MPSNPAQSYKDPSCPHHHGVHPQTGGQGGQGDRDVLTVGWWRGWWRTWWGLSTGRCRTCWWDKRLCWKMLELLHGICVPGLLALRETDELSSHQFSIINFWKYRTESVKIKTGLLQCCTLYYWWYRLQQFWYSKTNDPNSEIHYLGIPS